MRASLDKISWTLLITLMVLGLAVVRASLLVIPGGEEDQNLGRPSRGGASLLASPQAIPQASLLPILQQAVLTPAGEPSPPVQKVEMVAQRFHFSPSRIEVESGTRLEIRLRSRDTVHGFHVVGTELNVLIPARGRGTVTAVFDARGPGRYEFECSKKCGAGHTQMRGRITVKDSAGSGEKKP